MSAKDVLINKGYLVSPDLELGEDINEFLQYLEKLPSKPFIIDKKIYEEFQKTKAPKEVIVKRPSKVIREKIETSVKVKKNYVDVNKKFDIKDWLAYYFDRYQKLSSLLKNREELRGALSISRVKNTDGKVSFIAMIYDIRKLKNNAVILEVEDPTGSITVLLKGEAASVVDELVHDEVIGIIGTKKGSYVYAEKVIFPDIPIKEGKNYSEEVYAAFISDVHVGSNMFMPKELSRFIDWINGRVGNEKQKEMAAKTKYLFITGDLVDGVGVYPGQEKELLIKDIYKQYEEFARFFFDLPDDIHVIIAPGNHDALRLAEPQHVLFKDIAKPVFDLPNVTMVSNPAIVNIQKTSDFPGFDVLMYHGYSLDYYAANVPALRKTGYERADLLMKFLLKKRHLAPAHGSTLIYPQPQDFLVIDSVPDIFATAHIHKAKIGTYRKIITLSSSCWQGRTSFQEKVGHHPEPARVPIINLKTREAKMLRFG